MSWNLIILPPEPSSETATAALGEASEVRRQVTDALPGVVWSSPSRGLLTGDGFVVEVALQDTGPVESFMVSVTGDGNPVATVAAACRAQGWWAFDTVTGTYLDLEQPSEAGWKGYRAHVEGKVVPPEES